MLNQREILKRGGDLAELENKVKKNASSSFIKWVEEVPTSSNYEAKHNRGMKSNVINTSVFGNYTII